MKISNAVEYSTHIDKRQASRKRHFLISVSL